MVIVGCLWFVNVPTLIRACCLVLPEAFDRLDDIGYERQTSLRDGGAYTGD